MATLKMGSTTVLTDTTLANAVQDNVTRLGTITSGGAGISDIVKLYSNTVTTAVGSVSIDGYFDDSVYAYYQLHAYDVQTTSGGNPLFRVNVAGSANSGSYYGSAYLEIHNSNGTAATSDRANDNLNSQAYLDGTWHNPASSTNKTWNSQITIISPQATAFHKHFRIDSVSGGSGPNDYPFIRTSGVIVWEQTTAITGITLYNLGSGNTTGKYILYGFKK